MMFILIFKLPLPYHETFCYLNICCFYHRCVIFTAIDILTFIVIVFIVAVGDHVVINAKMLTL